VTDVTAATDLVTNLDGYQGRVIKFTAAEIDAPFAGAGAPQVAAKLLLTLDDADLRFRLPEAVRAQFDLQQGCLIDVDYGVMWRFNDIAQLSVVNATDITNQACDAPTVVSAAATANTTVVVTFDRLIDGATVAAGDFTFDQGLVATNAVASGSNVTVTTSAQVVGLTYTVTVSNVSDVLGTNVGTPNSTTFAAFTVVATMIINEINANITGGFDLVEILVTGAGTVNGINLIQDGSALETIATFPAVTVAVGDFIVVHANGATAAGAAPGSETLAKNQHLAGAFSANYDNAWDFHGGTIGLTFSNRVLRLEAPGMVILDTVPVVLTGQTTAAFPADLQAAQALNNWLPANCGGALCTYATTPTAVEISVDYVGSGNGATGNSVQRKLGLNTKQRSDWAAAAAQTFGVANPP